jgi:hypothetical protein
MSKTFRRWTIDQPLLLPPSVQDFVGQDHLARWTSMPRRARKRASQNPSRPASWVRMTRAISRPAAAHLAYRRSTKEANPFTASFQHMSRMPANSRQLNCEHPFSHAQFKRAKMMVEL